jgi:hypothetical protein
VSVVSCEQLLLCYAFRFCIAWTVYWKANIFGNATHIYNSETPPLPQYAKSRQFSAQDSRNLCREHVEADGGRIS